MARKLKTVDRAFKIVRFVSDQGEATASEVEEHLEMPTSTVFDYLVTLVDNGVLAKEDNVYRIGFRCLEYGSKARRNLDVFHPARSELDDLAFETNERVYLMQEENGHGVTIYSASGSPRVNIKGYDGMYTPLHTTAGGKAILAYLPEERLDEIYPNRNLRAINQHTITDWDELVADLEAIRERGVAFEREERVKGISSIATPVTDRNDRVISSVAIYGPQSRIRDPNTNHGFDESLVARMEEVSNVIQLNLYS